MASLSKITLPNNSSYTLKDASIVYGTCATAAATKDKEVALVEGSNFVLRVGAIVGVKFTYTNTYASATANPITLNVAGTGAKNIWYNNTHSGAGNTGANTNIYGYANRIAYYMYNGTYWCWISHGTDNNTTYSNASLGTGYATCSTAEATVAKVAAFASGTYSLVVNGIVSVKFTNAVPAGATLNINSKGAKAIFYKGAAIKAGVIKAGDVATFIYDNTQYHLIAIDTSAEASGSSSFTVSLAVASWSSSTTTVNGTAYYTYSAAAASLTSDYPTISCGSSSTLPSAAERNAFNRIDYVLADTSAKTLTFYAQTKPTVALTVRVVNC